MPANALAKYQQKITRRNQSVQKNAIALNGIPKSARAIKRAVTAVQKVRRQRMPSLRNATAGRQEMK